MSVLYACTHLDTQAPLPPSYPSSSSSFHPLFHLYFCEECDAVRCDLCVAVEIASYFCPNCLFDVPSANVKGDRNRCARSCFSCPQCASSLAVHSQDAPASPYVLACPGCKWNSKQVGWEFDKPTGIAMQLQKADKHSAQTEFDALKDHLEAYMTPVQAPKPARTPSRHISQATQMAAKALHRNPGLRSNPGKAAKTGWDEAPDYEARESWRASSDVERSGVDWAKSWESPPLPQRIPLQTKLSKRCPFSSCRHLLIQPDTKGVRMKIKMVAMNYLPVVELGRRRRIESSAEITDRRRRRRGVEEDEPMEQPLRPGSSYTFQLALTNPLYDSIQIRLTQPHGPKNAPPPNHQLHLPIQHFTIDPLKDAWAYDEEGDEEFDGSESGTTATTGTGRGLSVLDGKGEKRSKESGVDRRGNVSRVALELDVSPTAHAGDTVEFDLEVRFTYRAEEAAPGAKEYKTFTFWVRVSAGQVGASGPL